MPDRQYYVSNKKRFGEFVPGLNCPVMAVIEITNRCNMACPICFSDANNQTFEPSLSAIRGYLQKLLIVTKKPIPIQISGGEPSMRHDLPDIIALAKDMGYCYIELITNGIKIGLQPDLIYNLKEKGLTSVYLQFDGLKKSTYLSIRGQDMTLIRHKAIDALRRADICCNLAVVVTKGVNDTEIGSIVKFAIDNCDVVRAVNFQSATRFAGRFDIADRYQGYNLEELTGLIEDQTGVEASTFLSEHLGHSDCNAMSLVFIVNNKLEPLFKYISRQDLHDFFGEDPHRKILDAFSGKKTFFLKHINNPVIWKIISKAVTIFGSSPLNALSRKNNLLLFAKSFVEGDCMDPERISRCCYAIAGEDGVFSFCAYNNLYRFADHTPFVSNTAMQ